MTKEEIITKLEDDYDAINALCQEELKQSETDVIDESLYHLIRSTLMAETLEQINNKLNKLKGKESEVIK